MIEHCCAAFCVGGGGISGRPFPVEILRLPGETDIALDEEGGFHFSELSRQVGKVLRRREIDEARRDRQHHGGLDLAAMVPEGEFVGVEHSVGNAKQKRVDAADEEAALGAQNFGDDVDKLFLAAMAVDDGNPLHARIRDGVAQGKP
jgi:hypothetical protein